MFSWLVLAQEGLPGGPTAAPAPVSTGVGVAAPAPGANAQQPGDPGMSSLVLIMVMLVVFYFLLIRPQQKRQKKHQALLKGLNAGDEVITSSGIFGKITEIQGQTVTVEIAKNTKVRVLKNYVAGLANKDTEKELAEAPR
ncbi:MAG: preprotein translocase subunit YajC [Myxococcota bacterium]|jgi:preprotein translocase subunit YajC|nr:preprotein translocase subunit YajC [Myxococcota bacterium]